MKFSKITFLAKSIFLISVFVGTTTMNAQVEFRVLTGFGTRFNDVNDNGIGITQGQYYDFATDALTDMEPEATGLASINNNGDVAGQMYFDEPNFIMQPAYKKNGTWNPIGWFPNSNPLESSFSTYAISPNGKYVTGQMSEGCCEFGTFLYDTEAEILYDIFDPAGEALAGYTVTDEGIIGGWLDQPNGGGTLRVPAFFNKEGEITLLPEGQLPVFQVNAVNDINSAQVMVGNFDGQPFIYDLTTETFTTYEAPTGNTATFVSISNSGIAVGYEDVQFEVREAIIYHPELGPQPLFLKDLLFDLGVTIDTFDGRMGTAYAISPNGNFVVGWVNGFPPFAEGWIVNLDDLIVLGNTQFNKTSLSAYPNPVEDVLHLRMEEVIHSVKVYTLTGQEVSTRLVNHTTAEINVSGLTPGVYLVRVFGNDSSETLKIVKQ